MAPAKGPSEQHGDENEVPRSFLSFLMAVM